MNWNVLLTFGIAIGAYLAFLGLWTLIKYHKNKKRVKKEIEENEQQDKDDTNKK